MKSVVIILAAMFFSFISFSQTYNQSSLFYNTNKTFVRVISNPVKGVINLQVSNPYSEKYDFTLYTTGGQKITEESFNHPGDISTKNLYIPDGVTGIYFLVARTKDGQQSFKVLVE